MNYKWIGDIKESTILGNLPTWSLTFSVVPTPILMRIIFHLHELLFTSPFMCFYIYTLANLQITPTSLYKYIIPFISLKHTNFYIYTTTMVDILIINHFKTNKNFWNIWDIIYLYHIQYLNNNFALTFSI